MSYIELSNISLTFKTKFQKIPVFNQMNFSVDKGEFVAIIGPSGKGKSTLLNIVSGFVKPKSGSVIIGGTDISKMKEKKACEYRNSEIGYIFQSFNLLSQLNVYENIKVPLIIKGYSNKEANVIVDNLLDIIGLKNRKKEYPKTLSGGEQQRVAIARALANKPKIILADEPTGNLDDSNANIVMKLLQDFCKENNCTVLCVSHSKKVLDVASRVIDISNYSIID